MTVDNIAEAQPEFYKGHTCRFTFSHQGQLIHGTVTPDRGLLGKQSYGRRMGYLLVIDGELIGRDQAKVAKWHWAFAGWLMVIAGFGLFLFFWIRHEPDKMIEKWIESLM